MRLIEVAIGAVLTVMVLNVILNPQNQTAGVINAGGSNLNTIFGTLLKPGG